MTLLSGLVDQPATFLTTAGREVKEMVKRMFLVYRQFPLACLSLGFLYVTTAFCYYPIFDHWVTGFMMMGLPLATLSGLIACIYLFCKGQKTLATAGLIWFLFALFVNRRLVGLSPLYPPKITQNHSLKVLSFNSETASVFPAHSINSILAQADIACFQEYSPNAQLDQQFPTKIEKLTSFDNNRRVGLALFSRYPIIHQYSRIWNRPEAPDINGFLYADIAYGSDTIRVVNVHLWSMGIRTDLATEALKKGHLGQFAVEVFNAFNQLKEGFEHRHKQFQEVESYVVGSRYPVIIGGDFNETPYGYSYGKLEQNFQNAFEKAGRGFGFTLNRHPYCVRIDQQFVSNDWSVQTCQTLTDVSFSDHFPVLAEYVLKNRKSLPPATQTLAFLKSR